MKRLRTAVGTVLLATGLASSACVKAAPPTYTKKELNEQLVMATLWVQISAEYRALCYQAMNMAKLSLERDLAMNPQHKKRAIIVDTDETILQANEYEASLIGKETEYPDNWTKWLVGQGGPPIPGVVEFLNYAATKGVETFYISNRYVDEEQEGTMNNLKKYNFPFVDKEHFLFRKKGESSDKEGRRKIVASTHHITLLLGDNLDDFTGEFYKKKPEDRYQETEKFRSRFGADFIVLPNPMYGSWEDTLYNYEKGLPPEKKNKIRKEHLRGW